MNYIDVNFKLLKKNIKNIISENNLVIKKIKIIAVSKNQNVDIIKKAILSGINNFGENYVQESIVKIKELKKYTNITWHFIGKIQSNKTKIIAQYFDWCQTIDQEKTAILLNQHRPKNFIPINVLIQINISKELNKNGVNNVEDCYELAEKISLMPHLNLRGIMAMPEIQKDFTKNENQYKKIKIIFNKLKKKYTSIDTLSLGTSDDIKESLLATSNMIRIGRNIFHK
ncbi:YggS family pyridoxal phosphate-dependent enzyme [Buchnera aphidicola (Hyperomyzus lactucae)]|uniref:Pyridoxal phosphate homeostasis protein n=1 Tax=Buchnera aphidicola (Hyperomyzus lactucae) TaxID=1241860 RepID=A0A4D6XYN0_9GAMM|nr:YggS family pyridoxal phosphate-dependent enzyme [Buchnera aphidicola]QCI21257.1 YggS family pyridoxal phosphate-dependent enzyme [Buchnera aphidicola (Hyperomyzus lactucae)]